MKPCDVTVRAPLAAVRFWVPTVLGVMVNDLLPWVRYAAVGRFADASEEEIITSPAKPVAVLFAASFAVTVKLNEVPEIAADGT